MDISLNICTKPVLKKLKNSAPQTENKRTESLNKVSDKSKFEFKKKNNNFVNNVKFKNDDNLNNSAGFTFVKNKKQFSQKTNFDNRKTKGPEVSESGQRFVPKNKEFALFGKERKQKTFPKRLDIEVKKSENIFGNKSISFTDLEIHDHIVTNLEKKGIAKATNIQQIAIPKICNGENLMVRSETGSGKTLAYSIPIVNALRSITPKISRKDGIQALVIVPTRELALQTLEVFKELVYSSCWIVPGIVCGGENRKAEKERLRKGLNILIGTPGRLLDHLLHSTNLKLENVRCLVIDEADSLVEMGHKDDVKRIAIMVEESKNHTTYDPLALLKGNKKSPKTEENSNSSKSMPLGDPKSKNIQTIFLSATLSKRVEELKDLVLKNYDSIESSEPVFEKTETSNITAPNIEQKFIVTEVKTRLVVLASLIVKRFQEEDCKMFIFMDTRQMVEFHEELFLKYLLDPVAKKFDFDEIQDSDEEDGNNTETRKVDIEIFKIHGDMEQKDRSNTYKAFRNSKKGILLCTDAAARGIDIPTASYVIQYTAPLNTDLYLHRIGRTARAGRKGESIIFLTELEVEYINHVRKEHNIKITSMKEERILENLIGYMSHLGKMNSQTSAEKLQKRFEEAVEGNKSLFKMACQAYMSWYRYYRMFPKSHRDFFNAKQIHQGHYIKSFALKVPLAEIISTTRKENTNNEKPEKKLNIKLALKPDEERKQRELSNKRKNNIEVSEFDSGLKGIKKKKFKNKK